MSKIHWKLSEYLKLRNITAEQLTAKLNNPLLTEIVYRLVKNPTEQQQIDLSVLAEIMEAIVLLTDHPLSVSEIMEFVPELPQEFVEKSEGQNVYLYGDLDPYDWGDVDPMEGCKAVRYVTGIGLVIDDDEIETTNNENNKEFNRITKNPNILDGKPCIRNLEVPVETIIAMIASHNSTEAILKKYPELEQEDIDQALAYAAYRIQQTKLYTQNQREVQQI